MSDAGKLIQRYSGSCSRNDCFVLALARQEQCVLLAGDHGLRNAAEMESTPVRGTIWVIERFVRRRIITRQRALSAYLRHAGKGPAPAMEYSLQAIERSLMDSEVKIGLANSVIPLLMPETNPTMCRRECLGALRFAFPVFRSKILRAVRIENFAVRVNRRDLSVSHSSAPLFARLSGFG